MTISELAEAATVSTRDDGHFPTYTFQPARNTLPAGRRFKWTGLSAYGLSEWAAEHAEEARIRHSWPPLAGEVLCVLKTSSTPVHLPEIRRHPKHRFTAKRGSINAAIRALKVRLLRVDKCGYMHRLGRAGERRTLLHRPLELGGRKRPSTTSRRACMS